MSRSTKQVPDHAHGTNGYTNYGCRCPVCTEGQRAQQARYRERLAATDPANIPHGTTNGYDNYSCRCTRCGSAKAASRNRGG